MDNLGRHLFGLGGSALEVDVVTVRCLIDRMHLGTQIPKNLRSHVKTGTIRAVQHHPETAQRLSGYIVQKLDVLPYQALIVVQKLPKIDGVE